MFNILLMANKIKEIVITPRSVMWGLNLDLMKKLNANYQAIKEDPSS